MFRKVLIANRGEIAVRVIRTLREMDIRSVAVYSDADRASLHVRMADEAAHVGSSPSAESYLRIDRILEAARKHGAEAIHPGYGFLSENAEFAAACEAAGMVFIGPPADAIRKMGSKTAARELAVAARAPVVPGMQNGARDAAEAREFARQCGYPVLLKAVAGGGGKGMRRVERDQDLASAFRDASSEAERAFGDSSVYVEKLIDRPRHIEIQLMGDRHGNLIHLGERECSLQRRHQKIMEECPSPLVAAHPEMRKQMGETAIRIAKAAGYSNAGTIEFLVEANRKFYFLEMNTRLQVEHPVTELVAGLDLVKMQVEIAAGEKLRIRQEDLTWHGAAIECRDYAEDPDDNFSPSPGRITHLDRPSGPGIRLDSGVYPGWTVPLDYDPLLAKLAVWAATREEAIARMIRALDEYHVVGIKTNLGFFRQLLADDEFQRGALHTGFIDEFFNRRRPEREQPAELDAVAALVAYAYLSERRDGANNQTAAGADGNVNPWLAAGRDELLR
ncbi:MAG: acetyl-CoA carboxylase biotin carboxylase subunit [Acidobacteria bacterium]|nr:MAG: acetyl-CoA carboxylase biotin carboxylase subunit [Acidobacteriota bacterium]